jgi:hypothetical protein
VEREGGGVSFEETLESIVRKVVREELQTLVSDKPEDLLKAEDVRQHLNLNNVQKVYALVRENQLEAIWISKREMRFAPSAVRDFQLKRGIQAA